MQISKRVAGLFAVAFCLLVAPVAKPEEVPASLAKIRLESYEPVAGEAVFRLEDGKLVVVGKGKTLAETGAVLTEVLKDRVVLELSLEDQRLTLWMYPAKEPGKPGRVRVTQWRPPETPVAPQPVIQTIPVEAQPRPPRP